MRSTRASLQQEETGLIAAEASTPSKVFGNFKNIWIIHGEQNSDICRRSEINWRRWSKIWRISGRRELFFKSVKPPIDRLRLNRRENRKSHRCSRAPVGGSVGLGTFCGWKQSATVKIERHKLHYKRNPTRNCSFIPILLDVWCWGFAGSIVSVRRPHRRPLGLAPNQRLCLPGAGGALQRGFAVH